MCFYVRWPGLELGLLFLPAASCAGPIMSWGDCTATIANFVMLKPSHVRPPAPPEGACTASEGHGCGRGWLNAVIPRCTVLTRIGDGWLQNVAVSQDCLDMLTKVLVAEPAQRMSMEDIKCHPWFLEGLPPGALDMNEFLLKGMEPQASVGAQDLRLHIASSDQLSTHRL